MSRRIATSRISIAKARPTLAAAIVRKATVPTAEIAGAVGVLEAVAEDVAAAAAEDATEAAAVVDATVDVAVPAADGTNFRRIHRRRGLRKAATRVVAFLVSCRTHNSQGGTHGFGNTHPFAKNAKGSATRLSPVRSDVVQQSKCFSFSAERCTSAMKIMIPTRFLS